MPNAFLFKFCFILQSTFRLSDGSAPTREAFLRILSDIEAILIRATYHTITSYTSLRDLRMDTAIPTVTSLGRTPMVESCRCPEGHTGLSCEQCADGYLRVQDSGSALGRCIRCNCNNHASTCDPETGVCLVRDVCEPTDFQWFLFLTRYSKFMNTIV